MIWETRVFEPAKLYVRLSPELAAVSVVLALLKAPVSEAAAKTLRDPVTGALVVLELGGAVVVEVVDDLVEEQAASTTARVTVTGTKRRNG
jgi:hypothetical protein